MHRGAGERVRAYGSAEEQETETSILPSAAAGSESRVRALWQMLI